MPRPLGKRQLAWLEGLAPHHALINVRREGQAHFAALSARGLVRLARDEAGAPMEDFVMITAAGLAVLEQADAYPRGFSRKRPEDGSPS